MVDGISRAAYSKYWVLEESNQERTKENTRKWNRNENNAATDGQRPRNTSYIISVEFMEKRSGHITEYLSQF